MPSLQHSSLPCWNPVFTASCKMFFLFPNIAQNNSNVHVTALKYPSACLLKKSTAKQTCQQKAVVSPQRRRSAPGWNGKQAIRLAWCCPLRCKPMPWQRHKAAIKTPLGWRYNKMTTARSPWRGVWCNVPMNSPKAHLPVDTQKQLRNTQSSQKPTMTSVLLCLSVQ